MDSIIVRKEEPTIAPTPPYDKIVKSFYDKDLKKGFIMKVVNVMNFVRRIDEREKNSTERLLSFTADQLRLVNE